MSSQLRNDPFKVALASMVGTAISAFATPRLVQGIGYFQTHVLIAVICAVTAAISFFFLKDSPATIGREVTPLMPKIVQAFKVKTTWQLCFLYAVVFGAFVAFSNYLPTYLSNIYSFNANDAGMRAAGFAVAAVIARPFGGVLADKFGPKIITLISLGGVVILAVITAFQPDAEHVYGAVFILMAALLGLGHGSVFGWVARAADPKNVGAVSGVVAAAGALQLGACGSAVAAASALGVALRAGWRVHGGQRASIAVCILRAAGRGAAQCCSGGARCSGAEPAPWARQHDHAAVASGNV